MKSLNYNIRTAGPPELIETFNRRQVIIGGLSPSKEASTNSVRIAAMLRQNGQEIGKYTIGYAHSYSLRMLGQKGLIIGKTRLEERLPGPEEIGYEAILISL